MKTILCIKQVPESYTVHLDPVTNTLQRDKAASVLNPFDLFATEEAVRLKERYGGSIYAFTMGIPAASKVLKDAMSMGADGGFLLSDRQFAGADTLATAYTLAQGIQKQGSFDLVICGRMATDGDTAQVPPILAEFLGIPALTDVCSIISIKDGFIRCRRMGDDHYSIWKMKLPALITVTKEINVPRLPSIAGLRYAFDHPVTMWTAGDFPHLDKKRTGLQGSATQVKRTFVPRHDISTHMIGGTPEQQAAELVNEFIRLKII